MDLKKILKTNQKGFTFIEIVVVLGIFAVITSVVLFNFKDFSSGVSLQNLTQQIALQVSSMQRSALAGKQPFALAAPGFSTLMSPGQDRSAWVPSYGVCFTTNPNKCRFSQQGQTGAVNAFSLFADDYNDYKFDNIDERLDVIEITGGDYIYEVCVNEQTSTSNCVDEVIVVFERPNASPKIMYGNGWVSSANDLTVKVRSPEGLQREVVIWKSGQVEVN